MKPRIKMYSANWRLTKPWFVGRVWHGDGWHNVASSSSIDYVYNKVVRQ